MAEQVILNQVFVRNIDLLPIDLGQYGQFESLCLKMVSKASTFIIACLYRPPGPVSTEFCSEMCDILDQLMLTDNQFIICGDFNCPGRNGATIDDRLHEVLLRYNQQQLVVDPTHEAGHTLDLLITPEDVTGHGSVAVRDVTVNPLVYSDHSLVCCRIGVHRDRPATVTYNYRRIKDIDLSTFSHDVICSRLYDDDVLANFSANKYADLLDVEIKRLLDHHAPLRTNTKRRGAHDQRKLSEEARAAKCRCRRLERRFRRSRSAEDMAALKKMRKDTREKIDQSRTNQIKEQMCAAAGDSRSLWRTAKQLLHSPPPVNTTNDDDASLCNDFSTFFSDKVGRVRTAAAAVVDECIGGNHGQAPDKQHIGPSLSAFSDVTVAEVVKLLNQLPNKSSPLDALPTSLLKNCTKAFAPIIAHLAQLSFREGVFPSAYKTAHVSPLLKKSGLNRSDPANYRPISNLNTVSKVIERLVLARLKPQLFTSDNFSRFQSAYRQGHSTETALLCALESVYSAIDKKKLAVLVGLDISAAFDTVNHAILLERLHSVFGVTGTALNWLSSYLSDRQQYVQLGRHRSSTIPCFSGVPQGSVLGALLFIAYVSPVGDVITRHGLDYHQYADDTHLLLAVNAATIQSDLSAIEICSTAVKLWFAQNDLLLNADKSELMFIGTSAQLSAVAVDSVKIAGAKLPVSTMIKSLGVLIDRRLSFDSQVNAIARACNYHIWALRHIRRLVTVDVAKTLACSIVGARLDYCNSLLNGTSNKNIAILQRLQNSLARVVLQMPRSAHTTPLLQSLHWLPVRQRIQYKVAVLAYNAKISSTPPYLHSLLIDHSVHTPMSLRSSDRPLLAVNRTRTDYGRRAFSVAAATVWNNLPTNLQSLSTLNTFRSHLKTFLFSNAFGH